MTTIGVIPAAGKATRWGGAFAKELLPIGDGRCLIDHSIDAMVVGGADAIMVVTRIGKIELLSYHLSKQYPAIDILYAIQRGQNDIWSAIETSFGYQADRYLFAMPDTLYDTDAFLRRWDSYFALGTFQTDQPERFGVLHEGQVVNKQPLTDYIQYRAWGVLMWTSRVVEHWQLHPPDDYTDAINSAIAAFGLHEWSIGRYFDMACWADYLRWMERYA